MPAERVRYDPTLTTVFASLRVGASFFERGIWRPIHGEPDLIAFEQQHGLEHARHIYNRRCIVEARQTKHPVLGRHAGFCDWFVPVLQRGEPRALVVTGPFATAPPDSSDVLERWRKLTGRQGHPADPEFAYFVSVNLHTLVLDPGQLSRFRRLLECLARVIGGDDDAAALADEIDSLREPLEQVRLAERTWEAARSMIDQRTSRVWSSRHRADEAARLGLKRPADRALVGLAVPRRPHLEPIDDLIQRYRFQRASVELARKVGDTIAGQVGDHGVVFLSGRPGTAERRRQFFDDLGARATDLARGFGLELHVGTSSLSASMPLSEHYRAALQAAEMALSQRVRVVVGAPRGEGTRGALSELRRELGALALASPKALPACFERYLETVASHYAYRLDAIRANLEVGVERILDAVSQSAAIAPRTFLEIAQPLERSGAQARTVFELFATYRAAVSDIAQAALAPVAGGRDRSVRRALEYIHAHYAEPLTLGQVATLAGFAPNYFSALFKRRERMTFARYVQRLRTERAHQLLATTDLALGRVAELSGFSTPSYMARVMKRSFGTSPRALRRALR